MAGVDAHLHVGCHHAAGDGGKAAHHHGHQFRFGQLVQIGTNDERSFGRADEDVGGRRQALGAGRAHGPLHDDRHNLDQALHHAEMVQQRHQGREEDDARQHAEGENVGVLFQQVAEDEIVSRTDEAQQQMESVIEPVEDGPAGSGLQHQQSEHQLQQHAAGNQSQANPALVRTEQPGQADQHPQAEEADQARHGLLVVGRGQ